MRCPSLVISLAGLLGLATGVSGCGASIQAVYEGDVRFEHCMALDAQPDVQSVVRRACWVEWVHFYTYGQTRDRVVHAQIRIQQLSGGSELSDPSKSHGPGSGEPVAAMQSAPSAPVGTGRPPDKAPASADPCMGQCRTEADDCSRDCSSAGCHRECSVSLRSCVRRCG